jgi:hypothetical protein
MGFGKVFALSYILDVYDLMNFKILLAKLSVVSETSNREFMLSKMAEHALRVHLGDIKHSHLFGVV